MVALKDPQEWDVLPQARRAHDHFDHGLRGRRGAFKLVPMSKAEILKELPKLKPDERREVLERLWDLEDQDLINGLGPSPEEKAILDRELADYQQTSDAGTPWQDVKKRLNTAS